MVNLLSSAVPMWARRIAENLPEAIRRHAPSMEHIEKARDLFDMRCLMMIAELDGAAAAKRSSKKSPDAEAQEAVESFSAEDMTGVEEHVNAERRRSWVPSRLSTPAIEVATSKNHP